MSAFRRVRRDEQGVTMLELVVVVLILGIISTVLFNFLDSTTNVTARATSNVVKENEGRQAMRELTQDIRAANKILTTAPTDGSCNLTPFPAYPARYPNCLRFEIQRSVSANQACPKSVISYGLATTGTVQYLKKSRRDYAADCSTVTRNITATTVVANVSNTAATPLFEYFNGANQPITSTTAGDEVLYVKAASVRVNLWLRYKTKAPDVKLTSAVAIRNNR